MKKRSFFLAIAFAISLVSCKKEEITTPNHEPETLAESTVNFESLGEIEVKAVKNEKGQVVYDYGSRQKEVDEFFASNPDHVMLIDCNEEGKTNVSVIKSEKSKLFPKSETSNKPDGPINKSSSYYTVTFYDDDTFSDRYLRVHKNYDHYDSDLKDTYSTYPVKKGFNDKTSSLKIKSPMNQSLRVTLYDDKNYQDTKIILTVAPNTYFNIAYLGIVNTYSVQNSYVTTNYVCLLYTSDAADE